MDLYVLIKLFLAAGGGDPKALYNLTGGKTGSETGGKTGGETGSKIGGETGSETGNK